MTDEIEELKTKLKRVVETNRHLNEQQRNFTFPAYSKDSMEEFRLRQEKQPLIEYSNEITGNEEMILTHKMTGMSNPARRQA